VPALVDVWSGVVMAVATGEHGYAVRCTFSERYLENAYTPFAEVPGHARNPDGTIFAGGWAAGDESVVEERWLREAAAEFDPANPSA